MLLFWSVISLLRVRVLFSLCACVFSLFSLSGFFARSLTHWGSHYASPTLAHWFPYTPLSRAVRMVGVGGGDKNCLSQKDQRTCTLCKCHTLYSTEYKVGSGAATLP